MECSKCKGKDLSFRLVPRCDIDKQPILIYLAVALGCDQPIIEAVFFATYALLGIRSGPGCAEYKWICRVTNLLSERIWTLFPNAIFKVGQWGWARSDTQWKPHFPRQSEFIWVVSEWTFRLEFFGEQRLCLRVQHFKARRDRIFELFNDGQFLRYSTESFKNRKIGYYGLHALIDRQLRRFKFVTRK